MKVQRDWRGDYIKMNIDCKVQILGDWPQIFPCPYSLPLVPAPTALRVRMSCRQRDGKLLPATFCGIAVNLLCQRPIIIG